MKKTDDYQTTRIWKRTHYLLKLLSSTYQESMVELLDRLAEEELQRAKERGTVTNFPGISREKRL
jgi:hypothetical protein